MLSFAVIGQNYHSTKVKSNSILAKRFISLFLLGCFITIYYVISSRNSFVKYPAEKIVRQSLEDLSNGSHGDDSDLVNNLLQLKTKYILNTPFYVYEELSFKNGTFAIGKGGKIKKTFDAFIDEFYLKTTIQRYSDDYWFMQSALNHPMRVRDPKKAKLFFVPALMNLLATFILDPGFLHDFCYEKMCNEELLRRIDDKLSESEWFQRNKGKDHIIVASHYGYNTLWEVSSQPNHRSTDFAIKMSVEYRNIFRCNKIVYENAAQDIINQYRINYPSMHVGIPCTMNMLENYKKYRYFFLAKVDRFDPAHSGRDKVQPNDVFYARKHVCEWLENNKPANKYEDLCGEGYEMCPNIKFAKYGFHVKGDSFGSSRLIDLILNGVVPIFTSEEQYKILPQWIPWRDLSYFIDVSNETLFHQAIHTINSDEQGYRMKYSAITEFRELFDYTKGAPFDMYMFNFAENIEMKEKIFK